jgi:hypothetical protein
MEYVSPDVVDIGEAHALIQDLGHKFSADIPDSADLPSDGDYEVDE